MNPVLKWKLLPDSVKSSIAFAASTFILRGISFITTPIFTRIMDQEQYGLMATYNSWLSIIEVFAVLGLTSAGVFNSGLNEYRNERDKYIFSVLTLCNISTIIVFALVFIIKIFVPGFLMDYNLLVLMVIHFLLYPSQIFWTTRQRYEYKYKLATMVTLGAVIIGQAIAIIAVVNTSTNQGAVKLWANEIGWIIFCIPIYIFLIVRGHNRNNLKRWKGIAFFAIPLIPHYLAQHVMSGADRIMISNMVSSSDAGIYNVVATISMISVIFWNAINASLIPYTYDKVNNKDYMPLNSLIKLLLIFYGVICISVVLIAPEVLEILAPKEYYKGVYAVPPIAGVAFLNALYNIYANIEFYHKKAKSITIATIVAAIVNIGLNALLIPHFSFIGAAYTTLVSNIVLLIMHYHGYRNSSGERVYDDKRILKITIFVVCGCIATTLLYFNDVIRYCIIALVLIMAVIKRKHITIMINSIRGVIKK